jgi:hypothetical protein
MTMELSAPGIFVLARRWQQRVVVGWLAFHAVTYAMITIIFLPHILCLTAFLPLERLLPTRRGGWSGSGAGALRGGQLASGGAAGEPAAVGGHRAINDPGKGVDAGREQHGPDRTRPGS